MNSDERDRFWAVAGPAGGRPVRSGGQRSKQSRNQALSQKGIIVRCACIAVAMLRLHCRLSRWGGFFQPVNLKKNLSLGKAPVEELPAAQGLTSWCCDCFWAGRLPSLLFRLHSRICG